MSKTFATTMTVGASGMPLGQLPEHHAARDPQRPAITAGGASLSRLGMAQAANGLAEALVKKGVRHNDFVAICLPNQPEFYIAAFAIWAAGATPFILSPKLTAFELRQRLELGKPRLVIAAEPDRFAGWPVIPPDCGQPADTPPPDIQHADNWKAVLSGGSTGAPKIIVDRRPALWDPAVCILGMTPDVTVLNPGPLSHNAPFAMMHSALFVGAHVVEMGRFDPVGFLRLIEAHRVQWVNVVPTMMKRVRDLPEADRNRFDLSSLDVVLHMAASCPPSLKRDWMDWLGPERIMELFGTTERAGTALIRGDEWLEHPGSVGRVQPGSRMRILDPDGNPCQPGEVGEIFYLPDAGQGSSYYYIGSTPRSVGEWDSFGDLGYFDDDGYLYLADRRTDLIISGGRNIYPAEIEAHIVSVQGVRNAAAIGLPDDDAGEIVHAIVERADDNVDADAILSHLAERMEKYKLPRSIEFVSAPLADEAGKIRRRALVEERVGTAG